MHDISSHGSLFQATVLAGRDMLTHYFTRGLQRSQVTERQAAMQRPYYGILQDCDFSFQFKLF
jgi:hypothetical protein